jgi:hypothetical protein
MSLFIRYIISGAPNLLHLPRAAIARPGAPTVLSAWMKSTSAQKTRLWIKASRAGVVFEFIRDRRLRADVLFIRAQSAIRADATPSAQAPLLQLVESRQAVTGLVRDKDLMQCA